MFSKRKSKKVFNLFFVFTSLFISVFLMNGIFSSIKAAESSDNYTIISYKNEMMRQEILKLDSEEEVNKKLIEKVKEAKNEEIRVKNLVIEKKRATEELRKKKIAEELKKKKEAEELKKKQEAEELRKKKEAEELQKKQEEELRQKKESEANELLKKQNSRIASKSSNSSNSVSTSNSGGSMQAESTAYLATCNGCSGITATGINVLNRTHLDGMCVIATDPRVIPLGSKVLVNGTPCVAADTGGAIKGNKIDILVGSNSEASNWGRRTVSVEIVGKVNLSKYR